MRYNVITKLANLFYKLANKLSYEEIKQLIPTHYDCSACYFHLKEIFMIVRNFESETKYILDEILQFNNILSKMDPDTEIPDIAIKQLNKCKQELSQWIFTTFINVKKHIIEALFTLNLVTEDIKLAANTLNTDNISKKNQDFIDIYFTNEEIEPWINNFDKKLNALGPHTQNIKALFPKLRGEEDGIIEDWLSVKSEFEAVLNILIDLSSDLKLNSRDLGAIVSMVESNIDKIISIYEPSKEEEIERIKDLMDPEDRDDPEAINDALEGRYF